MNLARLFSRCRIAGLTVSCLVAAGTAGVLSLSAASADTPFAAAVPGVGIEVAPGSGTLYYDWGCDGSYSSTSITFNTNGAFTTSEGPSGTWVRIGGTSAGNQAGLITFQYTNLRTTYSSVTTSGAATGIQSTFSGLNGCHHILRSGLTSAQQLNDDTHSADGAPVKR